MEEYGVGEAAHKLEHNIIEDPTMNYLFSWGDNLKDSLIDIDKAYWLIRWIDYAMAENLGYELNEEQVAWEMHKMDEVHLEDDFEEEYEGEKWDWVLLFMKKNPSILPKIISLRGSWRTRISSPKEPCWNRLK